MPLKKWQFEAKTLIRIIDCLGFQLFYVFLKQLIIGLLARKKKEDLYSIFQTRWGTTASIITVVAACVGAGYYFGRREVIMSYETTIEDMRFQQLQMQLDFQKALAEEKMKLSQETVIISLEEYKQLLLTPVVAKNGKTK